jgi:hypothetical protein
VRRDEEGVVVADYAKNPGNSIGAHHRLAVGLLC